MRVVSASRRVDMVAGYPDMLADRLEERCPTGTTHTVVIWTKKPFNLFRHDRLNDILRRYRQLFILYSVTGLGGTALEPNAPATAEALAAIPELADLAGDPRRVKIRFDPIVRLKSEDGELWSNIDEFDLVAEAAAGHRIEDIIVSWVAPYRKVVARLLRKGFTIEERSAGRIREEYAGLLRRAGRHGVRLHACCVNGLPMSRCVDGSLLAALHPDGLACSTKRAAGQREGCGCTESWDIGWYLPCPVGCLYCYANPVIP